MYDISDLSTSDVASIRSAIRELGNGAKSMEEVAERVTRYFYNSFADPKTGKRSVVLARFYKTHAYKDLSEELQKFSDHLMQKSPELAEMKCLTLLATAGEKPEWNSRNHSIGHKAIPLPSENFVAQLPMVAQLVKQLGLKINELLKPNPAMILDMSERSYNVFHIEDAVGHSAIPAQQEFVIPHKVKSVLGFGGVLPWGDLFAVILFTNVSIPRESADKFKTVALGVKVLTLPFSGKNIFL